MKTQNIRVLIADDQLLTREGWKRIFETCVKGIEVIGETITAQETPRKVQELQPDVLLIDLKWREDESAGAAAIAAIKRRVPGAKIIAVTAYRHLMNDAREAGATTVLSTGFTSAELESVIKAVYEEDVSTEESISQTAAHYKRELESIETGREDARQYEKFVKRVLTFLLEPHLAAPQAQGQAAGRTQIRDLTFFNSSDHTFWTIVRDKHGGAQIVFEAKNVMRLANTHIIQLADYLKEPLGDFGIIVTRFEPRKTRIKKLVETFKDHGKMILILSDEDIRVMLEVKANAGEPTDIIKQKYLEITRQV